MHTVIAAITEVTPDRLTHVLRRSGALPSDEVRSVTVARVHDEQLHSISYFLHVTFSGAAPHDVPARLFLKLPREADPADAVAPSSGAREVRMYQALAPDAAALPIIPCYDAVYDMERRRYHLLLADLSETHEQPAWHLEIAEHYVTRTIDCLARFHAYWWEHPRLNNGMGVLPRAEAIRAEIEAVCAAFPRFVDSLGARLAPEDRCASSPRAECGRSAKVASSTWHSPARRSSMDCFWAGRSPGRPVR